MMERARHQTILPFTRYLAGPADYTTMLFNERRRDSSVAHQIASLAVFASPLLTIAANPRASSSSPAVDVIKSIPPVWDETIVLPDSEIGESAVYARRTGSTWFLAAMCGPAPKTLRGVACRFSAPASTPRRSCATTAPDGSTVKVEAATHQRGDTLDARLARRRADSSADFRSAGDTVKKVSAWTRVRWGIVGCGDVTEVKSGPGFQKARGSALSRSCGVIGPRRKTSPAVTACDRVHRHGCRSLMNDPGVDAVYIATPPSSHCELALEGGGGPGSPAWSRNRWR